MDINHLQQSVCYLFPGSLCLFSRKIIFLAYYSEVFGWLISFFCWWWWFFFCLKRWWFDEKLKTLNSWEVIRLLLFYVQVTFLCELDLYLKNCYLTHFCFKLEFDLPKCKTGNTINYIKNLYAKGLQHLCLRFWSHSDILPEYWLLHNYFHKAGISCRVGYLTKMKIFRNLDAPITHCSGQKLAIRFQFNILFWTWILLLLAATSDLPGCLFKLDDQLLFYKLGSHSLKQ